MRLMFIGASIILIGFIVVLVGMLTDTSNVKVGFFGPFGPIPFGFSDDKRMFLAGIVLTALIVWLFSRGLK